MSSIKLKVDRNNPCKICGRTDYCYRLEFDNGDLLHCCAKKADRTIISGGVEYVWKKSHDTRIGEYNYYQERDAYEKSREAFIADLKKFGKKKDWKKKNACPEKNSAITQKMEDRPALIKGEWPLASAEKRDAVYRRFLSLLKLSKRDYERLKSDWNTDCTGDLISKVLAIHPIVSLAPPDWVRNLPNYSDSCENRSRREVCKILTEEGYDLRGIPGFYLEENENWNYVGSEGMLFPQYDNEGHIVFLRLRESYPVIKAEYKGVEGSFSHCYSKKGYHLWIWNPKEGESELVWSPWKQEISLKRDGCPAGKPEGKYKNFSSVWEKTVEENGEKIKVNGYGWGTRSGSNISLYCRPGDDCSTVYVTEGEKKAIIGNLLLGVPVISLPGIGCFGMLFEQDKQGKSFMDYMVNRGMKLCVIAYDADKNTNMNVLSAEKKAVSEFMQHGLMIAIGEWNPNFGKGLDDILVTGVRPSVYVCQ